MIRIRHLWGWHDGTGTYRRCYLVGEGIPMEPLICNQQVPGDDNSQTRRMFQQENDSFLRTIRCSRTGALFLHNSLPTIETWRCLSMGKRVNFLPDSPAYQWNEAVEAFLHYKKATHRAPKTIEGYKHTLDIYYRRTGPDLSNPVSLKKNVLEFLKDYENPYSYNLHRTHLRAFFNWCIDEKIIEGKNPVKGTPFKKTSPRIRHLDDKTLRVLLGAPDKRTYDGLRDYTMMPVMLDCGIRPGELLQLLPRHFDVKRATIHVVDKIAKTRVERILDISGPTMNAIKKVISARHPLWGDNVPIFCSRDGREMTSSTWGHEFKKYVKRRNLDDAISPYDLRHTFAIMFLRNGGNLFALKTIMGHEQLEMTERYARFVGQDVKSEHERASPVKQLMSKRASGPPKRRVKLAE